METTDRPSYVVVPASASDRYWENWAEEVARFCPCKDAPVMLRTFRKGRDGQSDAQFLVDRLASGLHYAEWSHTLDGAHESITRMAGRTRHDSDG